MTVVFADLVGSTARADQPTPRTSGRCSPRTTHGCARELEHFGGTVEKFVGDAVVAVFGAPVVHEDDPERAVRAALSIQDAIAELSERPGARTSGARRRQHRRGAVALDASPAEGEGMVAGDVINTVRAPAGGPTRWTSSSGRRRTARRSARSTTSRSTRSRPRGSRSPCAPGAPRSPGTVRHRPRRRRPGAARRPRPRAGASHRGTRPRARRARAAARHARGRARDRQEPARAELWRVVEADEELISWRQGRSLPYGEGVAFWALGEMVKAQAGILESDSADVTSTKLARAVSGLLADEQERRWVEGHLRPLVGLAGDLAPGATSSGGGGGRLAPFPRGACRARPDRPRLRGPALGRRRAARLRRRPRRPGLRRAAARRLHGTAGAARAAARLGRRQRERADGVAHPALGRRHRRLLGPCSSGASSRQTLSRRCSASRRHPAVRRGVRPDARGGRRRGRRAGDSPGHRRRSHRRIADDEKRLLHAAAVLGKVFWSDGIASMSGDEPWSLDERLHALERKEFVRRERRSAVEGARQYAFVHALVRDTAYGQIPRADRRTKPSARSRMDRVAARRPLGGSRRGPRLPPRQRDRVRDGRGPPVDDLRPAAADALREAGDRAWSLGLPLAAAGFYRRALDMAPALEPDRASSSSWGAASSSHRTLAKPSWSRLSTGSSRGVTSRPPQRHS